MSKIQDAQRTLRESGLPPGKHRELQIAIVELGLVKEYLPVFFCPVQ